MVCASLHEVTFPIFPSFSSLPAYHFHCSARPRRPVDGFAVIAISFLPIRLSLPLFTLFWIYTFLASTGLITYWTSCVCFAIDSSIFSEVGARPSLYRRRLMTKPHSNKDYPIWYKDHETEYKQGNLHALLEIFRFRHQHCCLCHSAKFNRLRVIHHI